MQDDAYVVYWGKFLTQKINKNEKWDSIYTISYWTESEVESENGKLHKWQLLADIIRGDLISI